jgi:hypothetical protein
MGKAVSRHSIINLLNACIKEAIQFATQPSRKQNSHRDIAINEIFGMQLKVWALWFLSQGRKSIKNRN